MTSENREHQCACGAMFTQKGVDLLQKTYWSPSKCEACELLEQVAQQEKIEATAKNAKETAWATICPPLYRDTDPTRIHPSLVKAATSWTFNPTGLAFLGKHGLGKTRAMFLLLRRMFDEKRTCLALSAIRLAKLSAEQFDDDKGRKATARELIERASVVEVLFIDDLGKQKFTERAELDLFDLLETRTSNLLPTHWTANASGQQLSDMLSADRGEPLLRRLKEFSEIIKP